MIHAKFFSKFHQESVQKHKTVFEIAYLLTCNFRNKFKNTFKQNDRQNFFENADLLKRDIIFFQNFVWVNFSTETKGAPKINQILAGRFLPFYLREFFPFPT